MTPSIEEIRQTVTAAFKSMMTTYFSTLSVEYPNWAAADREHLTGPFVVMDVEFVNHMERFGLGDDEVMVRGRLCAYYLYRDNTGLNSVGGFLDKIKDTFCYKTLSGIVYNEMVVYNVSPSPGVTGQKVEVRFLV